MKVFNDTTSGANHISVRRLGTTDILWRSGAHCKQNNCQLVNAPDTGETQEARKTKRKYKISEVN